MKRARFFITCKGKYGAENPDNEIVIRQSLITGVPKANPDFEQISMFSYFRRSAPE
jgi:hypothetical protein